MYISRNTNRFWPKICPFVCSDVPKNDENPILGLFLVSFFCIFDPLICNMFQFLLQFQENLSIGYFEPPSSFVCGIGGVTVTIFLYLITMVPKSRNLTKNRIFGSFYP